MPGTVDENIHNLYIVSKMLIYKKNFIQKERERYFVHYVNLPMISNCYNINLYQRINFNRNYLFIWRNYHCDLQCDLIWYQTFHIFSLISLSLSHLSLTLSFSPLSFSLLFYSYPVKNKNPMGHIANLSNKSWSYQQYSIKFTIC